MSRRLPQEIMEVFDGKCSVLRSSKNTEVGRGETLTVRHILILTLYQNISYAQVCRNISDLLCIFASTLSGKECSVP